MAIKLQDIYGLADLDHPINKFDATKAYAQDDLVISAGSIYKAKAAVTPGPWVGTDWEEIGGGGGPVTHPIDKFDPAAVYAAGDVVLHNGDLYRAEGAVSAGAFDSKEWVQITQVVHPLPTGTHYIKVRGGILGGQLVYVDGTTFTVKAFLAPSDDPEENTNF